jgi:phage RecT family recombinase
MSANQQVTVIDVVTRTLQAPQMQGIIKQALPAGVSEDRFTRATLTALRQNPDIFDCDRNSLYNAIVRCAQDGLMPDGRQAAIVKFRVNIAKKGQPAHYIDKAQHMPMVEGVIYLLAKAGVFAYAASVYANDTIEIWNDENGQHVKHIPAKFGTARGERLGAFALGKTKDGQVYVEAMDMNDLEVPKRATKQRDKDGNLTGPWRDVPDRMEQKSCLHRLAKRIPSAALREDDEFREDAEAPPENATVEKGASSPPPPPSSAGPPSSDGQKRPRALQAVIDAGGADPAPAAESSDEQPEPPAQKAETKQAATPEKKTPPAESEVF